MSTSLVALDVTKYTRLKLTKRTLELAKNYCDLAVSWNKEYRDLRGIIATKLRNSDRTKESIKDIISAHPEIKALTTRSRKLHILLRTDYLINKAQLFPKKIEQVESFLNLLDESLSTQFRNAFPKLQKELKTLIAQRSQAIFEDQKPITKSIEKISHSPSISAINPKAIQTKIIPPQCKEISPITELVNSFTYDCQRLKVDITQGNLDLEEISPELKKLWDRSSKGLSEQEVRLFFNYLPERIKDFFTDNDFDPFKKYKK
jgi:hypothetical protein